MKVEELRIGNWIISNQSYCSWDIKIHSGDYFQIKQVGEVLDSWDDMGASGRLLLKGCKPIPLTEEWLTKLGFTIYKGEPDKYLENEVYIDCDETFYYVVESYCSERGDWCHCEVEIEYVHQLQNLYFALTNKELTIIT